jgi:hypothetical protein
MDGILSAAVDGNRQFFRSHVFTPWLLPPHLLPRARLGTGNGKAREQTREIVDFSW